jgi:hypothetical protein
MPNQKTFGRRAATQPSPASLTDNLPPSVVALFPPTPAVDATPPSPETIIDVDRELEEWKAARKIGKRSFREPWRTLAIAATVGFGLSSWLLPDSVADVAQYLTLALCAASFFAGFRKPGPSRADN